MRETVRYRTSGPAVVSDTVDNETIIVDLDSGSYYELNHVGAAIWTQLLAGLAAGEIADDLSGRFGADPETAQRDLDALIGRLEDERLIVAADGAPAANGASPADVVDRGLAYEAPMFRKHTDMQELLLLDPVYEVDETGVAEPALSAPRQAHVLLDRLEASAAEAFAGAGGRREFDLGLAGERVHLRFAGAALADVMGRAFAQVMGPPEDAPGLVVDLWDSASTGTVMPPPPWDLDAYREQGKIRGLFGDGLFTLVHPGSDSLTVLSLPRRKAWFWVRSPESLGTWEGAAPLLTLLHLWLAEREISLLHAAAVGTPEGCLLVVGPTGAGKSTTALTGLEFGLNLLADDYCVLRFEPDPVAHALFSSAKASKETLARLPSLAPRVTNPEREPFDKAVLFPSEWAPERLLATAPVRGIVVPRVVDRPDSQVAAISPRSALAALAPSTLFQLPGSGEAQLRRLGRLAGSVPCHRLDAGSDPRRVAERLAALLDRA